MTTRRLRRLGAAFVAAACALSAQASLTWEQPSLQVTPKSTDEGATAVFHFVNATARPVTLSRIQPDCGCVVVATDKSRWEPNERGQLTARFIVGRQQGERTVPIQVWTDGGSAPSAVLLLKATVVPVVTFSEPNLHWKAEDPVTTKEVSVELMASENLKITDVRASNPAFRVVLKAAAAPHRFTLSITPPAVRSRTYCTISVWTTSPGSVQPHEHIMVARVL